MNIERATATHGAGLKWSQVRRGEIWEHRVKKAATRVMSLSLRVTRQVAVTPPSAHGVGWCWATICIVLLPYSGPLTTAVNTPHAQHAMNFSSDTYGVLRVE